MSLGERWVPCWLAMDYTRAERAEVLGFGNLWFVSRGCVLGLFCMLDLRNMENYGRGVLQYAHWTMVPLSGPPVL